MEQYNVTWRKSSYSGTNGGDCVEVGNAANVVTVRDTQHRDGVTLSVPAHAWATFTGKIRNEI